MPNKFKKGKLNLTDIHYFLNNLDILSKIAFKYLICARSKKFGSVYVFTNYNIFRSIISLNNSSKTPANSIIFKILSVFSSFISFPIQFLIVSSISSVLSKVPDTTSLINFLYWLFE